MGKNASIINLVVAVGVVVVVGSLLTATILSLRGVRGSINYRTCNRTLHAIGLGYVLYWQRNEGLGGPRWPRGATSGECLGALYPWDVKSLDYFSCPSKPTEPEFVDGEIRNAGYLQDVAIPDNADPLRVVLGDQRGNHEGGSNLLFADGRVEFCEEVDGLLPDPAIPEDTDVYSDQPDVDSTIDCNL